jgi:hypothetical protein
VGAAALTAALIAGVDLSVPSEPAAEDIVALLAGRLRDLGLGTGPGTGLVGVTIGTHRVTVPDAVPRVALSISLPDGLDVEAGWRLLLDALPGPNPSGRAVCLADRRDGPAGLLEVAAQAVGQRQQRSGGRAVVFPGVEALVGTVTVQHVLDGTAINRLVALDGAPLESATKVVTRDFVRPRWSVGELVLHVQRAARDTVVPFEVPRPTPCCAEH